MAGVVASQHNMQIKSDMKVGVVSGEITAKRSTAAPRTTSADPFESSNALDGALQSVPDVRSDAVDRAKQLINDPNYPSADTIKKLSSFLADKLTSGEE
jgi:hypothetical protein